jgi:acyl carrier protein
MRGEKVEVETGTVDGVRSPLREHLAVSLRIVLDEDDADRDLLSEGLIDSMAVMELVAYIEGTFDVIVEDEEIVADNFRSLDSMACYVAYKKTGVEFFSPYVVNVREFVAQTTPPEAFVLILNSGDDHLLEVPDRKVWPFPCDERGTWGAVGHPVDGEHAIAMLERLRELGATHIVCLGPELWWLDYYQGLRVHLERDGGSVAETPLGIVYELPLPVR